MSRDPPVGVGGEVEVVAAREEEHLPAVDPHPGRLGTVQNPHAAVGAALANLRQRLGGHPLDAHGWAVSGFRSGASPSSRKPFDAAPRSAS
jgi:hypothetical protein